MATDELNPEGNVGVEVLVGLDTGDEGVERLEKALVKLISDVNTRMGAKKLAIFDTTQVQAIEKLSAIMGGMKTKKGSENFQSVTKAFEGQWQNVKNFADQISRVAEQVDRLNGVSFNVMGAQPSAASKHMAEEALRMQREVQQYSHAIAKATVNPAAADMYNKMADGLARVNIEKLQAIQIAFDKMNEGVSGTSVGNFISNIKDMQAAMGEAATDMGDLASHMTMIATTSSQFRRDNPFLSFLLGVDQRLGAVTEKMSAFRGAMQGMASMDFRLPEVVHVGAPAHGVAYQAARPAAPMPPVALPPQPVRPEAPTRPQALVAPTLAPIGGTTAIKDDQFQRAFNHLQELLRFGHAESKNPVVQAASQHLNLSGVVERIEDLLSGKLTRAVKGYQNNEASAEHVRRELAEVSAELKRFEGLRKTIERADEIMDLDGHDDHYDEAHDFATHVNNVLVELSNATRKANEALSRRMEQEASHKKALENFHAAGGDGGGAQALKQYETEMKQFEARMSRYENEMRAWEQKVSEIQAQAAQAHTAQAQVNAQATSQAQAASAAAQRPGTPAAASTAAQATASAVTATAMQPTYDQYPVRDGRTPLQQAMGSLKTRQDISAFFQKTGIGDPRAIALEMGLGASARPAREEQLQGVRMDHVLDAMARASHGKHGFGKKGGPEGTVNKLLASVSAETFALVGDILTNSADHDSPDQAEIRRQIRDLENRPLTRKMTAASARGKAGKASKAVHELNQERKAYAPGHPEYERIGKEIERKNQEIELFTHYADFPDSIPVEEADAAERDEKLSRLRAKLTSKGDSHFANTQKRYDAGKISSDEAMLEVQAQAEELLMQREKISQARQMATGMRGSLTDKLPTSDHDGKQAIEAQVAQIDKNLEYLQSVEATLDHAMVSLSHAMTKLSGGDSPNRARGEELLHAALASLGQKGFSAQALASVVPAEFHDREFATYTPGSGVVKANVLAAARMFDKAPADLSPEELPQVAQRVMEAKLAHDLAHRGLYENMTDTERQGTLLDFGEQYGLDRKRLMRLDKRQNFFDEGKEGYKPMFEDAQMQALAKEMVLERGYTLGKTVDTRLDFLNEVASEAYGRHVSGLDPLQHLGDPHENNPLLRIHAATTWDGQRPPMEPMAAARRSTPARPTFSTPVSMGPKQWRVEVEFLGKRYGLNATKGGEEGIAQVVGILPNLLKTETERKAFKQWRENMYTETRAAESPIKPADPDQVLGDLDKGNKGKVTVTEPGGLAAPAQTTTPPESGKQGKGQGKIKDESDIMPHEGVEVERKPFVREEDFFTPEDFKRRYPNAQAVAEGKSSIASTMVYHTGEIDSKTKNPVMITATTKNGQTYYQKAVSQKEVMGNLAPHDPLLGETLGMFHKGSPRLTEALKAMTGVLNIVPKTILPGQMAHLEAAEAVHDLGYGMRLYQGKTYQMNEHGGATLQPIDDRLIQIMGGDAIAAITKRRDDILEREKLAKGLAQADRRRIAGRIQQIEKMGKSGDMTMFPHIAFGANDQQNLGIGIDEKGQVVVADRYVGSSTKILRGVGKDALGAIPMIAQQYKDDLGADLTKEQREEKVFQHLKAQLGHAVANDQKFFETGEYSKGTHALFSVVNEYQARKDAKAREEAEQKRKEQEADDFAAIPRTTVSKAEQRALEARAKQEEKDRQEAATRRAAEERQRVEDGLKLARMQQGIAPHVSTDGMTPDQIRSEYARRRLASFAQNEAEAQRHAALNSTPDVLAGMKSASKLSDLLKAFGKLDMAAIDPKAAIEALVHFARQMEEVTVISQGEGHAAFYDPTMKQQYTAAIATSRGVEAVGGSKNKVGEYLAANGHIGAKPEVPGAGIKTEAELEAERLNKLSEAIHDAAARGSIQDLVKLFGQLVKEGGDASRVMSAFIRMMNQVEGLKTVASHAPEYHPDGTIKSQTVAYRDPATGKITAMTVRDGRGAISTHADEKAFNAHMTRLDNKPSQAMEMLFDAVERETGKVHRFFRDVDGKILSVAHELLSESETGGLEVGHEALKKAQRYITPEQLEHRWHGLSFHTPEDAQVAFGQMRKTMTERHEGKPNVYGVLNQALKDFSLLDHEGNEVGSADVFRNIKGADNDYTISYVKNGQHRIEMAKTEHEALAKLLMVGADLGKQEQRMAARYIKGRDNVEGARMAFGLDGENARLRIAGGTVANASPIMGLGMLADKIGLGGIPLTPGFQRHRTVYDKDLRQNVVEQEAIIEHHDKESGEKSYHLVTAKYSEDDFRALGKGAKEVLDLDRALDVTTKRMVNMHDVLREGNKINGSYRGGLLALMQEISKWGIGYMAVFAAMEKVKEGLGAIYDASKKVPTEQFKLGENLNVIQGGVGGAEGKGRGNAGAFYTAGGQKMSMQEARAIIKEAEEELASSGVDVEQAVPILGALTASVRQREGANSVSVARDLLKKVGQFSAVNDVDPAALADSLQTIGGTYKLGGEGQDRLMEVMNQTLLNSGGSINAPTYLKAMADSAETFKNAGVGTEGLSLLIGAGMQNASPNQAQRFGSTIPTLMANLKDPEIQRSLQSVFKREHGDLRNMSVPDILGIVLDELGTAEKTGNMTRKDQILQMVNARGQDTLAHMASNSLDKISEMTGGKVTSAKEFFKIAPMLDLDTLKSIGSRFGKRQQLDPALQQKILQAQMQVTIRELGEEVAPTTLMVMKELVEVFKDLNKNSEPLKNSLHGAVELAKVIGGFVIGLADAATRFPRWVLEAFGSHVGNSDKEKMNAQEGVSAPGALPATAQNGAMPPFKAGSLPSVPGEPTEASARHPWTLPGGNFNPLQPMANGLNMWQTDPSISTGMTLGAGALGLFGAYKLHSGATAFKALREEQMLMRQLGQNVSGRQRVGGAMSAIAEMLFPFGGGYARGASGRANELRERLQYQNESSSRLSSLEAAVRGMSGAANAVPGSHDPFAGMNAAMDAADIASNMAGGGAQPRTNAPHAPGAQRPGVLGRISYFARERWQSFTSPTENTLARAMSRGTEKSAAAMERFATFLGRGAAEAARNGEEAGKVATKMAGMGAKISGVAEGLTTFMGALLAIPSAVAALTIGLGVAATAAGIFAIKAAERTHDEKVEVQQQVSNNHADAQVGLLKQYRTDRRMLENRSKTGTAEERKQATDAMSSLNDVMDRFSHDARLQLLPGENETDETYQERLRKVHTEQQDAYVRARRESGANKIVGEEFGKERDAKAEAERVAALKKQGLGPDGKPLTDPNARHDPNEEVIDYQKHLGLSGSFSAEAQWKGQSVQAMEGAGMMNSFTGIRSFLGTQGSFDKRIQDAEAELAQAEQKTNASDPFQQAELRAKRQELDMLKLERQRQNMEQSDRYFSVSNQMMEGRQQGIDQYAQQSRIKKEGGAFSAREDYAIQASVTAEMDSQIEKQKELVKAELQRTDARLRPEKYQQLEVQLMTLTTKQMQAQVNLLKQKLEINAQMYEIGGKLLDFESAIASATKTGGDLSAKKMEISQKHYNMNLSSLAKLMATMKDGNIDNIMKEAIALLTQNANLLEENRNQALQYVSQIGEFVKSYSDLGALWASGEGAKDAMNIQAAMTKEMVAQKDLAIAEATTKEGSIERESAKLKILMAQREVLNAQNALAERQVHVQAELFKTRMQTPYGGAFTANVNDRLGIRNNRDVEMRALSTLLDDNGLKAQGDAMDRNQGRHFSLKRMEDAVGALQARRDALAALNPEANVRKEFGKATASAVKSAKGNAEEIKRLTGLRDVLIGLMGQGATPAQVQSLVRLLPRFKEFAQRENRENFGAHGGVTTPEKTAQAGGSQIGATEDLKGQVTGILGMTASPSTIKEVMDSFSGVVSMKGFDASKLDLSEMAKYLMLWTQLSNATGAVTDAQEKLTRATSMTNDEKKKEIEYQDMLADRLGEEAQLRGKQAALGAQRAHNMRNDVFGGSVYQARERQAKIDEIAARMEKEAAHRDGMVGDLNDLRARMAKAKPEEKVEIQSAIDAQIADIEKQDRVILGLELDAKSVNEQMTALQEKLIDVAFQFRDVWSNALKGAVEDYFQYVNEMQMKQVKLGRQKDQESMMDIFMAPSAGMQKMRQIRDTMSANEQNEYDRRKLEDPGFRFQESLKQRFEEGKGAAMGNLVNTGVDALTGLTQTALTDPDALSDIGSALGSGDLSKVFSIAKGLKDKNSPEAKAQKSFSMLDRASTQLLEAARVLKGDKTGGLIDSTAEEVWSNLTGASQTVGAARADLTPEQKDMAGEFGTDVATGRDPWSKNILSTFGNDSFFDANADWFGDMQNHDFMQNPLGSMVANAWDGLKGLFGQGQDVGNKVVQQLTNGLAGKGANTDILGGLFGHVAPAAGGGAGTGAVGAAGSAGATGTTGAATAGTVGVGSLVGAGVAGTVAGTMGANWLGDTFFSAGMGRNQKQARDNNGMIGGAIGGAAAGLGVGAALSMTGVGALIGVPLMLASIAAGGFAGGLGGGTIGRMLGTGDAAHKDDMLAERDNRMDQTFAEMLEVQRQLVDVTAQQTRALQFQGQSYAQLGDLIHQDVHLLSGSADMSGRGFDARLIAPAIQMGVGALVANTPGYSNGGDVPGVGNSDTYLARLTPGEKVLNKRQALDYNVGMSATAQMARQMAAYRTSDSGGLNLPDRHVVNIEYNDPGFSPAPVTQEVQVARAVSPGMSGGGMNGDIFREIKNRGLN
jgi:hypothetical protein